MHRVHIHCTHYEDYWWVQYLETDLKTSARHRIDRYTSLDKVRDILNRASVEPEERAKFERGQWGIYSCFIDLTEEQYAKLKNGA